MDVNSNYEKILSTLYVELLRSSVMLIKDIVHSLMLFKHLITLSLFCLESKNCLRVILVAYI